MDHLVKKMRDDFYLDEGLVAQILVHLPAKSVIRFGAVCKEWLGITACPSFVAAYGRRFPLEVLLYTTRRSRTTAASVELQELDALDVSADRPVPPRRPLARYPAWAGRQYCSLVASCDGLLVLQNGVIADADAREQYLVCNPVTRQWSHLPRLRLGRNVQVRQRKCGFYFHGPSGEYRLLCHISFTSTGWRRRAPCYCILSTGADRPRQLSVQATPIDDWRVDSDLLFNNLMTPAVLHGHLHWLKHMEGGAADEMVAFDTVAETFRRMPPPPVTFRECSNLLVGDGSLMAAELGHRFVFVDLWVLDGYAGPAACTGEEIRWVRRHRVEVPWQDDRLLLQEDRLLLAEGGHGGDVLLGWRRGVVAYNVRSGTVRQIVGVDASRHGIISLSRRVFRGSLVRHDFFEARPHPGLPLFSFCS